MTDGKTDPAEIVAVVAAGPGLGRSVALRFAREGAAIALLARSVERLQPLVRELAQIGVAVHPVSADAADEASLRAALADVRRVLGAPTVLVFNASEYVEGRPTEVTVDALLHGVAVGVAAALVCVQEVVGPMRDAGRGTILLTGSQAATRPYVGAAALGVAKAGLRNLALSTAEELAPGGIHVTTVTINGVLKSGTAFDPDLLAEHYWKLHRQCRDEWTPEHVVDKFVIEESPA
jgi:NAD(P)-dependent dehydrogenase (short-subunit alcohol dehydrogenase family)